MEDKARWQDGVNLIFGAWLFASPIALSFTQVHVAALSAYLAGACVVALSILSLKKPQMWQQWCYVAAAGWLLLAPFVLDFTDNATATANYVLMGMFLGMDALWVMTQGSQQQSIT